MPAGTTRLSLRPSLSPADFLLHDLLHDRLQAGSNAVNATELPDGKALQPVPRRRYLALEQVHLGLGVLSHNMVRSTSALHAKPLPKVGIPADVQMFHR